MSQQIDPGCRVVVTMAGAPRFGEFATVTSINRWNPWPIAVMFDDRRVGRYRTDDVELIDDQVDRDVADATRRAAAPETGSAGPDDRASATATSHPDSLLAASIFDHDVDPLAPVGGAE